MFANLTEAQEDMFEKLQRLKRTYFRILQRLKQICFRIMQGLKRTRLRISHKLKRTCFLKEQSKDHKIGFSKSKRSQDRFSPSRRIVRIEEVKGYVHSAKEGINRNIDNARPASCMDQAGQKTCALN